jgi:hypothetical protein
MPTAVTQREDGFWSVAGTAGYFDHATALRVAAQMDTAGAPSVEDPTTLTSEAAQNAAVAAVTARVTVLETFKANLVSTDVGKGAALLGLWPGYLSAEDDFPPDVAHGLVVLEDHVQTLLAEVGNAGAGLADEDETLTSSGGVKNGWQFVMDNPMTADRTFTLGVPGAVPRQVMSVTRRGAPSLDDGFSLIIVNGGPAAGTLATLGPGAARRAEFKLNDAGTDWVLDRFFLMS